MTYLFNVLTHTKIAKIGLPGEPDISRLLAFTEEIFVLRLIFKKKE
jgi:hypothetical protein